MPKRNNPKRVGELKKINIMLSDLQSQLKEKRFKEATKTYEQLRNAYKGLSKDQKDYIYPKVSEVISQIPKTSEEKKVEGFSILIEEFNDNINKQEYRKAIYTYKQIRESYEKLSPEEKIRLYPIIFSRIISGLKSLSEKYGYQKTILKEIETLDNITKINRLSIDLQNSFKDKDYRRAKEIYERIKKEYETLPLKERLKLYPRVEKLLEEVESTLKITKAKEAQLKRAATYRINRLQKSLDEFITQGKDQTLKLTHSTLERLKEIEAKIEEKEKEWLETHIIKHFIKLFKREKEKTRAQLLKEAALKELRSIGRKKFNHEIFDDFTWALKVFLSNYLGIGYEYTHQELVKELNAKNVKNKEDIIRLSEEIVRINYEGDGITKEQFRKMLEEARKIIRKIKIVEQKIQS
jgi:hypothetical protein